MIERIIEASIRNRFLVLAITGALVVLAIYATLTTPIDAIPDLSENQAIVFADWMGRSPREIEDQVTYPLSRRLQGLAGVKTIRSSSEFNFSMITIIFEEGVDFYFARQRVTEKLDQAAAFLPTGVVPYLAPDATALGQIFWYTLEPSATNPVDPGRLWALNKFYVAQQLNSTAGVADVAVVGGMPLEYQVDIRPEQLRAYGVTLGELHAAIARSNMPAGGGVVQKNNAEYIVRGIGWIAGEKDIENTVVKEVKGVPIYVRNVATVQLGTQYRRGVLEKNGNDVTGGVVLMRQGENPLEVTERVKEKIQELQPGLPAGVHIVAAYDRTRLIHGAIHTLTEVMWHEMVIASLAVLLILMHVRSVFVICVTLPLSVLFSFLLMWLLRIAGIVDIQANIMSLAGLTISIGILVDQAIVMTENATHHLKQHFGDRRVTGDIRELVVGPCRTVGRPIFFSVMIMLLSFIPVFMLSGQEGKLFHPLAFTKSFAMIGVAIISVTVVPALIPTFLRGRLRGEEENWIVRSFINIYRPLLTWMLPRRNLVMWMFSVLLILAAGMFPLQAVIGQGSSETAWRAAFLTVFAVVTALTVIFTTGRRGQDVLFLVLSLALVAISLVPAWLAMRVPLVHVPFVGEVAVLKWLLLIAATIPWFILLRIGFRTQRVAIWRTTALASLVLIGLWAYHFPKIGVQFMPPLDEGSIMDMPVTVPRASVTQAVDDLKARDALLRGFPEVESVIGKAGRADTPTDPAPLDMVETFVNFRPRELWPKRVLRNEDAQEQTEAVFERMAADGFLTVPENEDDRKNLVATATQHAVERYDEIIRELASLRYQEFQRELEAALVDYGVRQAVEWMTDAGHARWTDEAQREQVETGLIEKLTPKFGPWLATSPAEEDATALAADIAQALTEQGIVGDSAAALSPRRTLLAQARSAVAQLFGGQQPTFATDLLAAIETERERLWHERVREINWELFDVGTETYTRLTIEELARAAEAARTLPRDAQGEQARRLAASSIDAQLGRPMDEASLAPFEPLETELTESFRNWVFLWPRKGGRQGDLVSDEMEQRVLRVPGWTNIFTQPIRNRIDMLSTGVRTGIGVKVFGPDLATIDRVCRQIEEALKSVSGATDVVAWPIMGKGYLEIQVRRDDAARYGITVEDVQNEIEIAIGGRAITYTVEERDRFPIRIRYARADRQDEESIGRLLVASGGAASSMSPPAAAGMTNESSGQQSMPITSAGRALPHDGSPMHAAERVPLIPLSSVADIRIVEGPAMIRSENGRLLNYVTLNVRGRDMVGFVEEARRVVAQKVKLPEGVHVAWSGEFEHQVRAAQTLRFVFPAVLALIFLILYLTYNDLADAVLMMLAVPEALAGGVFFLYLFPKVMNGWNSPPMDFSVAVWVGFIACFGMATETGIIMLVYLREAIEKRGGLENIKSLEELRQAVIEGAVHRLRPKLLTEGVAIIAIFPMVFARGVGGEILAPMALPVLGGLLISDEVVDLFLPVRFYWIRRRGG